MRKICLMLVLVIFLATLISCIGIHDSGEPKGGKPTLGQELIDLKKAHAADAISYEEYKELKAKLMEYYE